MTGRDAIWWVYLLECRGERLYCGITPDVTARFALHRTGKGAAFTRMHPPLRIVAAKTCGSRSEASRLEYQIKQLRRSEKLTWAAENAWP